MYYSIQQPNDPGQGKCSPALLKGFCVINIASANAAYVIAEVLPIDVLSQDMTRIYDESDSPSDLGVKNIEKDKSFSKCQQW